MNAVFFSLADNLALLWNFSFSNNVHLCFAETPGVDKFNIGNDGWGFGKFITLDSLKAWLPDDKLIIVCEVTNFILANTVEFVTCKVTVEVDVKKGTLLEKWPHSVLRCNNMWRKNMIKKIIKLCFMALFTIFAS